MASIGPSGSGQKMGSSGDGCPLCKMSNFASDRDLALHLEEHYKRSGKLLLYSVHADVNVMSQLCLF